VQAVHHAVVQFYAAAPHGERQPGDGLAVCLGEATDGTLADALTEHSDDLNLLGFFEDIHGGRNPRWGIEPPNGKSVPKLLYSLRSDAKGRNPVVDDQGPRPPQR